jgi:Ca2+-binding EF-hand superfamily protein
MDDNNDGNVNRWEFCKALKDFKVDLHPRETEQLYNELAPGKAEELNIDIFMNTILGRMSDFRRGVVEQTFSILDQTGKETITVERLRQCYNSRRHPEVISGQKTIDETLGEFIGLFEAFNNSKSGQKRDTISKKDFISFFTYMSPMIADDNDFEAIVACCRANVPTQEKVLRINNPINENQSENRESRTNSRNGSRGTHRLGVIAPFGVSNEAFYKTSYSAFNYPTEKQLENFNSKNRHAAGATSWPGTHYADPRKLELEEKNQRLLSQITNILASRGIAGFLHLLETFQNSDKNKAGVIHGNDFQDGTVEFSSPIAQSHKTSS